jgi:hypothetical protein
MGLISDASLRYSSYISHGKAIDGKVDARGMPTPNSGGNAMPMSSTVGEATKDCLELRNTLSVSGRVLQE